MKLRLKTACYALAAGTAERDAALTTIKKRTVVCHRRFSPAR
jgi:hypothetical protein